MTQDHARIVWQDTTHQLVAHCVCPVLVDTLLQAPTAARAIHARLENTTALRGQVVAKTVLRQKLFIHLRARTVSKTVLFAYLVSILTPTSAWLVMQESIATARVVRLAPVAALVNFRLLQNLTAVPTALRESIRHRRRRTLRSASVVPSGNSRQTKDRPPATIAPPPTYSLAWVQQPQINVRISAAVAISEIRRHRCASLVQPGVLGQGMKRIKSVSLAV